MRLKNPCEAFTFSEVFLGARYGSPITSYAAEVLARVETDLIKTANTDTV